MTRPVAPERIDRAAASTWVATWTCRRSAALRSDFSNAAVATALERKLDAVLDRLNQLEGRLNDREKTRVRLQKSSSACPQQDSRFRAVVPLLGPVSLALDFGCPLCRETKQTEQAYSFWIGLFK